MKIPGRAAPQKGKWYRYDKRTSGGRAADFVLKDYPNVVSVFVHASEEFNLARAMERNSMTESEMQKFIAKTDKYRADYYRHYTGRE